MITSSSPRTFYEALDRAGLAHPNSKKEIGERFLEVLMAGVDHELVGAETWYRRILEAAPTGRGRSKKS